MKRKISLITALILSAALVSCGNDVTDKPADEVSEEVSVTEVSEEETDEGEETTKAETEPITENEKLTRGVKLSDADVKQVVKVGIKGIFSEDTTVSDIYNINVLHTGVVGLFGCPVEISSSEFEEAVIVFEYNPDDMKNVPAESLIMLHYNEEDCFYDTIPSKLNEENHTVSAKITEPGAYMLADAYEWYRTWGDDASEYAHDILYTDPDFNFSMSIPEEIQLQYVSSPLEDDEEGKCQTLLECYANDNIQIGIEYLERPTYASAEEFITKIADILECEKGTITAQDGAAGHYFYINFGEDIGTKNLSMNCVFPIDNTHYINIWYGFTDEKYYETAVKSLESFKWNDSSAIELPTENATEAPDANPEKSVTASDISFKLPDGITAKESDEEWQEHSASDHDDIYFTSLYEFDISGYSDYLLAVSAELFNNNPLNIHTEADAAESLASDTNGLSFVKRDSVTLSNGCEGEVLSISIDSEAGEYCTENGVYYIYGWFETPDSAQRFNVTVVLDKDAPQEIFDELYNFVMSVDMK